MAVAAEVKLKVADEVWIAVALLHREYPHSDDFTVEEILERAAKESRERPLRPGVYVHIVQHCVANRPPNPGRYRMLFETSASRRRLFRDGDIYDPARAGSKTVPDVEEIPVEYRNLVKWYRSWKQSTLEQKIKNDPLLALRGSGKELWADEHADEYVRRLREGWE